MVEIENALNAEKEEFEMKMESLNQRKQDLRKKEIQLKESISKFDNFLKENDAKLSRAVKKSEDERELQKVKQKEIERLKEEIKQLAKVKDNLQNKVVTHSRFHKYLEQSVEFADEFQEIHEIINRYETLTTNYQDLIVQEKANEEVLNAKRKDLNQYLEVFI
jgi:chromosome segregation ATPase